MTSTAKISDKSTAQVQCHECDCHQEGPDCCSRCERNPLARGFPILNKAQTVPWEAVAPHEPQAIKNHGQSLAVLASRGGLDWCELLWVLEDRPIPWGRMEEPADAEAKVRKILEAKE